MIARNSAFTYKGRTVDVRQVGRELGVRYVLEGSIRRSSNRVRITGQLVEAATGHHIWAERFDGELDDVFDLQDRITESVVGAIQPTILTAEIARARRERPESTDAYDCVLRAFADVWALDRTANLRALAQLRRAIDIEPGYHLALALAAWCEARRAIYNWTDDLAGAKAEGLRLARLAGDLRSDDPMVLTMLCAAHTVAQDFPLAARLIEKALLLDPNSAWAWNRGGWLRIYQAEPDRAIAHFERAIRLSPLDPMNFNCHIGIGAAHFVAGRLEEGIAWSERGLVESPGSTWAHRHLAPFRAHFGQMEQARQGVQALLRDNPDLTISKVCAALAFDPATMARIAEGLRLAGLPE